MSQKTETVKSHSEVLKNPLGDFDEHLTLVDEMMQQNQHRNTFKLVQRCLIFLTVK
jgi:hypothetical protein